jgi:hypothetical protein
MLLRFLFFSVAGPNVRALPVKAILAQGKPSLPKLDFRGPVLRRHSRDEFLLNLIILSLSYFDTPAPGRRRSPTLAMKTQKNSCFSRCLTIFFYINIVSKRSIQK